MTPRRYLDRLKDVYPDLVATQQAHLDLMKMEAEAKAAEARARLRLSRPTIGHDTPLHAAITIYEIDRIHAGLPPLPAHRIRAIAKGKIALARTLREQRQQSARRAINSESIPSRARTRDPLPSVQDRLDAALWSPGSTAFWLDPDRWHGVPMGRDGRLEPFWLHLDKRPEPAPLPPEFLEDDIAEYNRRWAESRAPGAAYDALGRRYYPSEGY